MCIVGRGCYWVHIRLCGDEEMQDEKMKYLFIREFLFIYELNMHYGCGNVEVYYTMWEIIIFCKNERYFVGYVQKRDSHFIIITIILQFLCIYLTYRGNAPRLHHLYYHPLSKIYFYFYSYFTLYQILYLLCNLHQVSQLLLRFVFCYSFFSHRLKRKGKGKLTT